MCVYVVCAGVRNINMRPPIYALYALYILHMTTHPHTYIGPRSNVCYTIIRMTGEGDKNAQFFRLFLKRQKLPDYILKGPMRKMPRGARGKRRRPPPPSTIAEHERRIRARTKRGHDEAVARHRAREIARAPASKRDIAEVIASLPKEERAALVSNPQVIGAVEKLLEVLLFRFS